MLIANAFDVVYWFIVML